MNTAVTTVDAVAQDSVQEQQRRGRKRFLLTLPSYAFGMLGEVLAVQLGVAQPWEVGVLWAYTLSGLLIFYMLIDRGISARWREPMMTFPQVLFSISLVALAYVVMPSARALAMQWLCLIIVYDVRRLGKGQTWLATALAMVVPFIGFAISYWYKPVSDSELRSNLVTLGLGAFVIPGLLAMSAAARLMKKVQRNQKEKMAEALAQLTSLARQDGLTGLFNRRYMQEMLDEEVRRQRRTGRPFCLAMLDVDLFKRINDQMGHAVGDQVLQRLSLLAQSVFQGRTDVVARWGGEEFLVLMPETTQPQAYTMVMRLRAQILGMDWSDIHPDLKVTVSAGVAEHGRQADVTHTLAEADRALYDAKHAGRNQVCTAVPLGDGDLRHSEREQASWPKPYRVELPARQDNLAETMATALETKPARAGRSAYPAWSQLLFGTDAFTRAYLKLSLFGIANYLAVFFVLGWDMIPRGAVSERLGHFFQVYALIGATVPYALIRSGVTRRWRHREFLGPQLLWACAGLVMGYVGIPDARPFVLQLICVMLVFGFAQLSSRDAMQVGVGVLTMLVCAVGTLHWVWPDPHGLAMVWLQLSCTGFIVAMLSVQSYGFAKVREALQREKSEVQQATERVKYLLMHDSLTGLFNRQNAQRILLREQERQERSGQAFGVALIDLDHFKRINDTLGHGVGDEVLQGFAHLMKAQLRNTDVISRWGGEEFLLILTETNHPDQGLLVMSRLRQALAGTPLCKTSPQLAVTFSAGLVISRVGEPLSAMLERADKALYQAKAEGRDRCILDAHAEVAIQESAIA